VHRSTCSHATAFPWHYRCMIVVLCFLPVFLSASTDRCHAQGSNFHACLLLHAEAGVVTSCDPVRSVRCWYCWPPGPAPNTTVPPNSEITVFLFASTEGCYLHLFGVQTALAWDPSWKLLGSSWDCQRNQLCATVPQEPGGARHGTIATVFDCAVGNSSEVIGRLYFRTGASGCLRQVQSEYPFGTHVLDCELLSNDFERSFEARVGSVCVDEQGYDGCWFTGPVQDSSWGQIKAHFPEGN